MSPGLQLMFPAYHIVVLCSLHQHVPHSLLSIKAYRTLYLGGPKSACSVAKQCSINESIYTVTKNIILQSSDYSN